MTIAGKLWKNLAKEKTVELNRKIILSIFLIFACFLIDRIFKIYILNFFIQNNFQEIYINPFLNFIMIWNKGIAFGMLESDDLLYSIISIIIFIVIVFICYLIFKADKKIEIICYSVIVGGAIGNFADRIYYKAVPDFIDLHYKDFHWFTFNIADIFITTGVLLLLIFDMIKFKSEDNA